MNVRACERLDANGRILGLEGALMREEAEQLSNSEEGRLLAGYLEMAADREREADSQEWSEGLISDANPHEA